MNIYPILVFLHVLGGVGMFVALGIEAVSLPRFRRAGTPDETRAWMGPLAIPARLGPASMLTALASGIWMMAGWWGPQRWIEGAFLLIAGMAIAGGFLTGRSMRRVRRAFPAETGATLSDEFRSLRSAAAPVVSLRLRIAFGIGILALMTMKPGIAGSFLIVAAAVVGGLAACVPLLMDRPAVTAPNEAEGLQ